MPQDENKIYKACPSLEDVCEPPWGGVLDRFVKQVAAVWCGLWLSRLEERKEACFAFHVEWIMGDGGAVVRQAERKHGLSLRVAKEPDTKGDETERY